MRNFVITIISVLALINFFSCQNSIKSGNDLSNYDTIDKNDSIKINSEILYKSSFVHEFSNKLSKDSFNISVRGETLLNGRVEWEIKNVIGEIIYSESFPTSNIWDVTMNDSLTQVTEKYIVDFMMQSFNEKNFFAPAISAMDVFNDDYSNKEIWNELKADKTAIGFYYSSGYEDSRKIAFIKSLKKVVVYFECC